MQELCWSMQPLWTNNKTIFQECINYLHQTHNRRKSNNVHMCSVSPVYQRANGRRIKPALEAASECSIENHRWTFFIFGTSYHQLIRCRLHKWRLAAMDSPFDFEHCHTTVCPSKDYLSTSISLQHGRLSLVISKRYVLPLNATVKLNRFSNRSMQLHISFCFIGSLTFPPSLWPL